MWTERDQWVLEQLCAQELIRAPEAGQLLAAMRAGPADGMRERLLALRSWPPGDWARVEALLRQAPSTGAGDTIVDSSALPAVSVGGSGATAAPGPASAPHTPGAPSRAVGSGVAFASGAVAPEAPSRAVGGATPSAGPAPATIDRYEIVQEIARGGMGVVYKARDTRLDRIVALKVLAGGASASGEMLERFQREARTVAGLRHPRIVPVHDVGEIDGARFFTMEFIEGQSLARLLQGKSIGRRQGIEILRDIALALHHAHEHGVIHRDVKPGNILVDGAGRAFIADFGLAREVESDSRLTVSGRPVGTPAYMSPEQAGGERERADARTDVYSLGATLYDVLTGRPPYPGENMMEVIFQVIGVDPPRPTELDPSIPRDLEVITMRAMERDRSRRYRTAKAFGDDLGRYLEGEAIEARPSGVVYRAWRKARRHPVWITLGATAALLAAAGVTTRAVQQARRAREGRELCEQARVELAAGRPEQALTLLGRARSADAGNETAGILEDGCRKEIRARSERAREEARLAEIEARNARRSRAQPLAEGAEILLERTDVLARHGEMAQRRERLREAEGLLDRALAEDAEFAEAWYLRGRVRRLLGKAVEAQADLEQAVVLRDTYSAPYVELVGLRVDLYHKRRSPGAVFEQERRPMTWTFKDLSRDAEAQAILVAAHRDFERVLGLGVRPEDAHYLKGALAVIDGRPGDAVTELTRAVELHPYYAEAFEKRAFAHLMRSDTEAAAADIEKALSLWPAFAEAMCYRGVIRVVREDVDGALADFRAAAAIDPDSRQAIEGQAMAHSARGDWEAALSVYDEVLKRFPDAASHINRACTLLMMGRTEEGMPDVERGVELDPEDARGWALYGQAWLVKGDLGKARSGLEKAIALTPGDAFLFATLGRVKEKQGDRDGARAELDRAVTLDPGFARVRILRAEFRKRSGEPAGALEDFGEALRVAPDDAATRVDRAELLIALRRFREALPDLDHAARILPESVEVRRLRARARATLGDLPGARADLDAALDAGARDADTLFLSGLVWSGLRRDERAAQEFESFLGAASPDDPRREDATRLREGARHFAEHPEDRESVDAAVQTLAESVQRAGAAYQGKDWAAAARIHRAGIDALARAWEGRAPIVRELAEASDMPGRLLVHAWYNLACCLALDAAQGAAADRTRREDEALQALGEALRLGFEDLDHVRQDPDLAALRARPDFAPLLEHPPRRK